MIGHLNISLLKYAAGTKNKQINYRKNTRVQFLYCSYTFLYWLPKYIREESNMDPSQAASLSTLFDYGGILGGIAAGLITDKTGMSATTCSIMLIVAIPLLFLYNSLVSSLCPIQIYFPTLDDDTLALNGWPVHDACYRWNCLLLFMVGVLVNGPYALITTAVSAGLGQHPCLKVGEGLGSFYFPYSNAGERRPFSCALISLMTLAIYYSKDRDNF